MPKNTEAAKESVFVVFSYGDPMPITSCRTAELADEYAAALGRLPKHHPLYTENACVDELPLISELPLPLRDPENQEWDESVYSEEARPQTWTASASPARKGPTLADKTKTASLRETISGLVPDGFRDDDGVWHDGPHRRDALAALDTLILQNESCGNALVATEQARESWSNRARGLEGDLETLRSLCRVVVERYGRVWAKDTDYYAAAEVLGIKEPPE